MWLKCVNIKCGFFNISIVFRTCVHVRVRVRVRVRVCVCLYERESVCVY